MPARLLKVLLLLGCLLPGVVSAQELIKDFRVQLKLGHDGMLEVVERITVQAEGDRIQRGIYRDIPVHYRLPGGLLRKTPVDLLSATRDGLPEQVRRETVGAYQRFYLGSPDLRLRHGRYTYELRYRIDPQLLAHEGRDELYWNVTGNDWRFPILQASVRLDLPSGARIGALHAYTGASGERGENYRVVEQGASYLELRTTAPLPPEHGLTLAVDWAAGVVARPGELQQAVRLLHDNLGLVLGILLWLGLLWYYWSTWREIGRDPQRGPHFARFEAPDDLPPASIGYLWHRGLRNGFDEARALAVCFTDWAIRGLLRLEDQAHGGLVLQRGAAALDTARAEEGEWLRHLLAQDAPLALGSRYQPRLADFKVRLVGHLQAQGRQWFARNRRPWVLGLGLALLGCLLAVLPGLEGEDQWGLAIAGLVFALGFGVPTWLVANMGLHSSSWGKRLALWLVAFLFVWPALVGIWMLVHVTALPVALLLAAYVLLVAVFYRWLEAPSVKGQQLLDAAAGYRDYLQLAESEVLARAAAAPAMSIELYERHLPYAMALGVEAQWSARFAAALEAGLIDPSRHEYRPDWYAARERFSSPTAFSTALSSSLVSLSASASTPPTSSSSSSGGSSGGGSSGGGSGGGGGGGW